MCRQGKNEDKVLESEGLSSIHCLHTIFSPDTGLGVGDMKTAMNDRKGWKEFVQTENRQRSTRYSKVSFLQSISF